MKHGLTALAAVLLTLATGCAAYRNAPAPQPRYLFYLHGKIVEDLGPRGVSPQWGAYDYPGILEAFRNRGFEVLSETRARETDPEAYADKIVTQIRSLIGRGVDPSHITVVGASKGAVIAALVSARLGERHVRHVLLANCNDWLIRTFDPHLTGEVLSIYETSDEIGGSCDKVFARSPALTKSSEVTLSTGLGHGMVYRPLDQWVGPASDWARRPDLPTDRK